MIRRRRDPAIRSREDRLEFSTDAPTQSSPQASRVLVAGILGGLESQSPSELAKRFAGDPEKRPDKVNPAAQIASAMNASPSARPSAPRDGGDDGLELVVGVMGRDDSAAGRPSRDLDEGLLPTTPGDGRPIASPTAIHLGNHAFETDGAGMSLDHRRLQHRFGSETVVHVGDHNPMQT